MNRVLCPRKRVPDANIRKLFMSTCPRGDGSQILRCYKNREHVARTPLEVLLIFLYDRPSLLENARTVSQTTDITPGADILLLTLSLILYSEFHPSWG